ncbi:acyl-CoA dehydrogenase family protein [Egicoccus halophilus]|uniref:Acyl-CoA dehydrogenase n=1 Tax=Egicoccus halophilus TaxID=1670830 RepID=A0A8J3A6J0_9ACTN|nr:acyl-CoA dehydrogenase family protein [Egicoccus halophilus]GGI04707.1 acyl-CoA dehydrogenase [Egicoccus halophilus]
MIHRLPEEQQALLELVEGFRRETVAPQADRWEREHAFPRPVFDQLAAMDLTGLPFGEDVGGSQIPFATYLMVVEELARGHLAVGLGLSVHTLATWGIDAHATAPQREQLVPALVAGRALGAYSLSEPGSGSDAAAMTTVARRDGEVYRLDGVKAWVTHGGIADRYLVMARTGEAGARGISAFVVDADQPGLTVAAPEQKMGMWASPTAQLVFEDAPVPVDRLIGDEEGTGFRIAMASLDGGRLGIAACATGLAQAALDAALGYAREREQFGRPIAEFQGVSFLLADMATRTEASRTLWQSAADRRDHGFDVTRTAAMSKLFATDAAMQTTTDAVQVFGGYGYTTDFPVERYMREAKVLQIVEGTNQIQRLVIGRQLTGSRG